MTTDTTSLASILAAKKADLNGPRADPFPPGMTVEIIPPADPETGEIVPGTAVEPAAANATAPAVPAPVEVRYPEIPPKVVGGLPYIRDYVKLARTIDQTEMVPVAFRGRYDAITAAFMRGYEMGLGPMQALDSFNVIQGKVGLTAEAMRALILNAGHDIILEEVYGEGVLTGVKAACHRKQWPAERWAEYVYSLEDARRAGLLNKNSWKENTRAMLDARATSGAGRRYFADVLAGMSYTPEEIRDFSGPEQEVTPSPANTSPSSIPAERPAPTAEPPTPDLSPPSADASTSSSAPPKRPRGRPRKATTPPVAAPGPSASETPPATIAPEPSPEPAQPDQGPPELTSLNTGDVSVTRSMLTALTQIISGLPQAQQPACRMFIRQHYPEGSADLAQADIQKCIDIAAGWPDSAAQHPVPEDDQTIPMF
jgi:hypothetical protein